MLAGSGGQGHLHVIGENITVVTSLESVLEITLNETAHTYIWYRTRMGWVFAAGLDATWCPYPTPKCLIRVSAPRGIQLPLAHSSGGSS